MKALHTADFHIDNRNIDEAKKCLEFIIETIKTEKPDITIIAGDLFDSRNVKLESPAAMLLFDVITQMANLAPVSIVYGTPSHEGEATSALRYLKTKYNVRVSDYPEQYYMMNDGSFVNDPGGNPPKLIISAVPQPTKQHFAHKSDIKTSDIEIANAMTGIFTGFGATASQYASSHILIGHFSISGACLNANRQMVGLDIEISSEQIALAEADLVAMGHIHLKQEIQGNHNIFYSGSIFQKDFGEAGEDKGFYIHTFDGKKLTESKFVETPTRKLIKLDADLTENCGFEELAITLYSESADNLKDAYLRMELKVFQDEAQKVDTERIKNFFLSGGAKEVDVKLIRVPRENVRSQNILKLTTLREKLIEQASLKKEVVPETILAKADLLEAETAEKIITRIAAR